MSIHNTLTGIHPVTGREGLLPEEKINQLLEKTSQILPPLPIAHSVHIDQLNAWAIVNNLRTFLPEGKKAGQSLVESFGATLRGIPWMEALNLYTVGSLDKLSPSAT